MTNHPRFVDIHCHLLPEIDDGAATLDESLAMARMAVQDGIHTIIATPHQLGNFSKNSGDRIRTEVTRLQQQFQQAGIPLIVLPGGDVRIEQEMVQELRTGQVLTLGDQGRHILLELPHELYFPLEPVLHQLRGISVTGILSHPERNQGLQQSPHIIPQLVDAGCLMQVTAGSLVGTFGPLCQKIAERMLVQGCVHFLATDAHGVRRRRPLMGRVFQRASEIVGSEIATRLCHDFPMAVASGNPVPTGRLSAGRSQQIARRGSFFSRRAA